MEWTVQTLLKGRKGEAIGEALKTYAARMFRDMDKDEFVKDIKDICECVGYPVTVRRSEFFDRDRCFPKALFGVSARSGCQCTPTW